MKYHGNSRFKVFCCTGLHKAMSLGHIHTHTQQQDWWRISLSCVQTRSLGVNVDLQETTETSRI